MSNTIVNPLSEKLLSLRCYVNPNQIGSDILLFLLDNAKLTYEGKKYENEGLIIKINKIQKYGDIVISNNETSGNCTTTIVASCTVCHVPYNYIVCKVIEVNSLPLYASCINEFVIIPFLMNKENLHEGQKISKDSIIIVKVTKTSIQQNKILAFAQFVSIANNIEKKQYFDNEHLISD